MASGLSSVLGLSSTIDPRWRGVRFFGARFCSPPLSYMKQVPFESTGIGLQYM